MANTTNTAIKNAKAAVANAVQENEVVLLTDDWEISGDDPQELATALVELSKIVLLKVPLYKVQFMTYLGKRNIKGEEVTVFAANGDGKYGSYTGETPNEGNPQFCKFKESGLEKFGLDHADYYDELVNKSKSLVFIDGQAFFISNDDFWLTFNQRIGIPGAAEIRHSDKYAVRKARDNMFTMICSNMNETVQLLGRQDGKSRKLFAGFSPKYKVIPQFDIFELSIHKFENQLGRSEVLWYRIDNSFTEITLRFPDQAEDFAFATGKSDKFVPVIRIRMSDVGRSSVIFNAGYCVETARGKKTLLFGGEGWYSRQHTAEARVFEIVDKADTRLFASYKRLMDRLPELVTITVDGMKAPDVVKAAVEKSLVKSGAVSAGQGKKLTEALVNYFNASAQYTAYDVFMAIAEAPDVLDVDAWKTPEQRDALRRAALESAFVDYQSLVA